jgi:predicted Zn-ribbon and HTH transcriptional regulator
MRQDEVNQLIKSELGSNPDPGKVILLLNDKLGQPEIKKVDPEYRCACGLVKPINSFPVVDTGVCKAIYNVCQECVKHAEKVSHLCCFTCKEIYAHIEPGKKDKTGFEFQPGKFYHSKHCPQCSDKGKSHIAEMLVYFKKNNIPYKL